MAIAWSERLINWYHLNKRDMPWRSIPQPYYVWVSEMMLQQTQVDTVIPYFNRFIKAFPTIKDLATAEQQTVLKCWEGLGYYSRARNLHQAAQQVITQHNGTLPRSYEDLQTLPGIGPYCAAAITSIAFGHTVPVVDGNVLRVITRYLGITDDIRHPKVRTVIFEYLTPIIQTVNPSDFNQGLMECGALVCKPKQPHCSLCPLESECQATALNKTDTIPYKSKKAPIPHYQIGVGLIWKDNKLLIAQRHNNQMLGGLWEFPGGKQEQKETIIDTIKREIKEETSLDVHIEEHCCTVKQTYSHFKITLHAYHCNYQKGTARPNHSQSCRWVSLNELDNYPFPKANKQILSTLKKESLGLPFRN